jgi:hypothetical protein
MLLRQILNQEKQMKVEEMMDIFIDRQLQMKELEVLVNLTSNKFRE